MALFAAAVPALLFTSCGGDDKKGASKEEATPSVRVETVYLQEVNQDNEYTATAEPFLINNISAAAPNRIKSISVDEGMRVGKGQRLVVMDDVNSSVYEAQVESARANLHNVQRDYNRAVELFKIGGGTKQAVDQMETQLITARQSLSSAERTLRNARENTVLTSPISGVITARNYDPGDMTGQLPVLTVAQVQPLKIVINVTEADLPRVKKGMPASVKFDTFGDETFTGTVSLIAPTVDVNSRTFGVEVTIPNSDNRILPGMFGRVNLNLGKVNRVIVPDMAVVKQQGSNNKYVYVYNNGVVHFRLVELGRRLGDKYEIISGIEPGDKVVVSGQTRLADGVKVNLAK